MPQINKILLVDDEPDIRTIAEMSLSQVGGWQTVLASSGSQALELAASHKPDLILLDVMMPEMDGFATFNALADKAETRDIPVIFMTAKVQSHERERYVGHGAAGVIAKPFDPMRLPEDIKAILSQPARPSPKPSKMEVLRQGYAQKLSARLDELRAALDEVRAADEGQREATLETAHQLAHKLHGTAGTYGYPAVSEAMASTELALQELIASEDPTAREDAWARAEAGFQRARDSIR